MEALKRGTYLRIFGNPILIAFSLLLSLELHLIFDYCGTLMVVLKDLNAVRVLRGLRNFVFVGIGLRWVIGH